VVTDEEAIAQLLERALRATTEAVWEVADVLDEEPRALICAALDRIVAHWTDVFEPAGEDQCLVNVAAALPVCWNMADALRTATRIAAEHRRPVKHLVAASSVVDELHQRILDALRARRRRTAASASQMEGMQ
jgi:hypothetical protein